MLTQIKEKVVVAILVAFILGSLTILWNWAFSGGVIHALGGMTREDVNKLVEAQAEPLAEVIKADLRVGNQIIPAPGGNGQSTSCPDGTVMVGALWKVDAGGPSGIISWISPICRTMGF